VGGGDVISRRSVNSLLFRAANKIWVSRTPTHSYLVDYQFGDLLAELSVLRSALIQPPSLVHVLYGDEQLDLLLRHRRLLRCPLVASFHIPHERAKPRMERFQASLGRGLDAAIVLSSSEVEPMEAWVGQGKVMHVPHGVDTDRFFPAPTKDGDAASDGILRVIFVGEHMRDWAALHEVIDGSSMRRLPIHFDVVTRPHNFPFLTACANTTLHSGLSEEELLALYRRADVAFIPVLGATANNAALEAMACGVPIISTLVGGMPDYVASDCGWLLPSNAAVAVLDLMQSLCLDRSLARSFGANARRRSLTFNWPSIGARVTQLYQDILLRAGPRMQGT
jgi:glycosyltransferase involved in cell wall biosynthesis